MQLFVKILSGMANSVDPDQTLIWSTLFAYAILLDTLVYKKKNLLGHLPYYQFKKYELQCQKMYLRTCVPSENSDQTVHLQIQKVADTVPLETTFDQNLLWGHFE